MFSFSRFDARSILRPHLFKHLRSPVRRVKKVQMNQDYYVWIDLEMTGLDQNVDKILEIACIITNKELHFLDPGINVVIHQPKEVLDGCCEWAKIHLAQNGLLEKSLESKISVEEADKLVLDYIKRVTCYDQNKGTYYLAGNSVYMDKRFLEKYMVNINKMLHYRLVDVSALKTLCSHWYPEKFNTIPKKKCDHRAFSDILECINELNIYKEMFFKPE